MYVHVALATVENNILSCFQIWYYYLLFVATYFTNWISSKKIVLLTNKYIKLNAQINKMITFYNKSDFGFRWQDEVENLVDL